MKKFNLFVGLFLVILLVTNCKKESITPSDNGNTKPVFDTAWNSYLGTWKLIKDTDPNGVGLQNFTPANFTLNNDLTISSNWLRNGIDSWIIINNNELHFYDYDATGKTVIHDIKILIISITSTTLILTNIDNPPYALRTDICTFQKQ